MLNYLQVNFFRMHASHYRRRYCFKIEKIIVYFIEIKIYNKFMYF